MQKTVEKELATTQAAEIEEASSPKDARETPSQAWGSGLHSHPRIVEEVPKKVAALGWP